MSTMQNPIDSYSQSAELKVAIGHATIRGVKAINEDAVASHIPEQQHALVTKGIAIALADGVSSAEAGREASEYAVSHFIEEYYLSPDTWSVKHAGQKTLSAINLNLFKKSHVFTHQEKGYLCTFSALVIKSQTAHFFHAGDSRIYRLRNGGLTQLTRDHAINIGGGKNILARAVGMDNVLQVDYGKSHAEVGDVLLLTTDGVHDFVSPAALIDILSQTSPPQVLCDQIIETAQAAHSDDNISCAIAKVVQLPQESRDDFSTKLTRLPFPPDLEPGMTLDGYRIEKALFTSTRSQVYLVTDLESNKQIVMKTPSLNFEDDLHYIDRFIQEEWIGKRINHCFVVKIITQNRPRSCLYYLMEYVPGKSLDKWMLANPLPTPKKAITLIKQIAEALAAFHDAETIHQDLKPANIMVDDAMHIKLIDFGSVFVAGIAEIFIPIEHQGALGTATYSDPYYIQGQNTGIQGDIYSLATITYELFTGELPYGDKIEQCVNANDFDKLRYTSASFHNPIIPVWFDRALEKGTTLIQANRYRSLTDFINDINRPNPQFLKDDPTIKNRKGLMFWQLMSGFWVVLLLIVIVLFSTTT